MTSSLLWKQLGHFFFLKFPSYIEQSIAFYLMDNSKPDVILAQDFEIWQNLEDVKEKSIN